MAAEATAQDDRPQPCALLTLEQAVAPEWLDYNGHMTEWQYYRLFSDAGEVFLRALGFTEAYRLTGYSFFSVEAHIRYLSECRLGAALRVHSEVWHHDAVRLQIYQYLTDADQGVTAATCEHMMVHVDTDHRRTAPMGPAMMQALEETAPRWRPRLRPRGLGAGVRARTAQRLPG